MRRPMALAALMIAAALVAAGCSAAPAADGGAAGAAPRSGVDAAPPADPNAVWIARDPADVPPPVGDRAPQHVVVELTAREVVGKVDDGVTYEYWTFHGKVPGPMIRVREGDAVEIRLHNDPSSKNPHSIDLHAVTGPGGGAVATQVQPGETKAFRFKALRPGVYVYHCATPFVPAHIANGMYGLIVVEPAGGLPKVDREFYVMQGELYTTLRPGGKGHARMDDAALVDEHPSHVVFNGAVKALTGERAMKAKVGETVRIFFGVGGPNLVSSFHVIGEIFDVVRVEGGDLVNRNVQTTLVPAGGAVVAEFGLEVPGRFILVDHALSRVFGKGAVAELMVEGPENPEVFQPLNGVSGAH